MSENERCEMQNEHIKDIAQIKERLNSSDKRMDNFETNLTFLASVKDSINQTLVKLTTLFEISQENDRKRDEESSKRDELLTILSDSLKDMNTNIVVSNRASEAKIDSLGSTLSTLSVKVEGIEKKVDEKIEKIDDEIDAVKEKDKTWQGTLISKFNIGKKFSIFLKITTGILLVGIVLLFFVAIGVSITHAGDIFNWLIK